MPNKYSHAIVLSNYESCGLIDFNRPRPSKPASSSTSSKSTSGSAKFIAHPPRPTHSSSRSGPRSHLRLESTHDTSSEPVLPPLHRKTSSIETQIYAPLHSPTPPPTRNCNGTRPSEYQASGSGKKIVSSKGQEGNGNATSEERPYTSHINNTFQDSFSVSVTQDHKPTVYYKPRESAFESPGPSEPQGGPCGRYSMGIRDDASQDLPPAEQYSKMRHKLAVATEGPSCASSNTIQASAMSRNRDSHNPIHLQQPLRIPHDSYNRNLLAAQAFAPERPPSPPATPESDRSFSLRTTVEKPDPISTPPPVPERSSRRSPPGPSPNPSSSTPLIPNVQSEQSRPKTSPALSSPQSPTGTTFSVTTRTPSLKAVVTPRLNLQILSMPSEPFFDDNVGLDPLPENNRPPSGPFSVEDSDLESLPSPYIPSSPDFNIEPWNDDNAGPAIFRDGELNSRRLSSTASLSTRASSFDSAAPPPICMNRRMPLVFTDITSSNNTPTASRQHKKLKPSLASLAFFRSAPKAVLYSQTAPGTPPVPVATSSTAVPSIPALFPGYKGPFPPPERNHERSCRPSRNASKARQTRGRSVPPKASDRRRSWFRADSLERSSSFTQQENERDSEQLMKSFKSIGLR